MASINYTEPSGDTLADTTAEQVVQAMRSNGEYWGSYSPMGWLRMAEPQARWLIFIRHPRRGWYLQYEQFGEAAQSLVAVNPQGDRATWVEHWAEGDISYFLAACFVPQDVAERVVTDFFTSPEPSDAVHWEPFRYDTHRCEEPPDEAAVVEAADPES